jgi:phage-related protein
MLTAYTTYGQTDIQIDVKVFEDGDEEELGIDEVEELIAEFKAIMEIKDSERTVEQWNRAIEIIFIVYYGADLKTMFTDLQIELEKQQELNKQLSKLYSELNSTYGAQVEVLQNIKTLQNELENVFSSLQPGRSFYPYATFGFTSSIGFNAGAGLIIPITDRFIIGAGFVWHYDTDITKYFSFNFMFGWGF